MTEQPQRGWDASYTAATAAPWDIGRPQPAFARLAAEGRATQVQAWLAAIRRS